MDNQQQTIELEALDWLKSDNVFVNKVEKSIEQNSNLYHLIKDRINRTNFNFSLYEKKINNGNTIKQDRKKIPDGIARFQLLLLSQKQTVGENKRKDLNIVYELVYCAIKRLNSVEKYYRISSSISVIDFANTVRIIATEILPQIKKERQQAHQEQDKIDNYLTLLGKIENIKKKIEDIKKYLIGKIQNNNDLYNIINDEIKFVNEQSFTIFGFFNHLNWQKDKRNKKSRYNNESEEIKNRFKDMHSLFYHLNYNCGDDILKI